MLNRTRIKFLVENYAEKNIMGIYLNFFISYNFNIVSSGHFGFLQHELGFKT